MPAWFLNSQTGQQQFGTPDEDYTRSDMMDRQRNRITGNAGYGAIFTQTPGGVQRAYHPSAAISGGGVYSAPYSVGTGRSAIKSPYEENVLGNIKSGVDTAGGISSRLQNISQQLASPVELPEFTPKMDTASFHKIFGATTYNPEDVYSLILDPAKQRATKVVDAYLSTIPKGIEGEAGQISSLSDYLSGLNIPSYGEIGSTGVTPKQQQAMSAAIARLRDTGMLGSYQTLESQLTPLEQQLSDLEAQYSTVEGALRNQLQGYGVDELSDYMEGLSPDWTAYRELSNPTSDWDTTYQNILRYVPQEELNTLMEFPSFYYEQANPWELGEQGIRDSFPIFLGGEKFGDQFREAVQEAQRMALNRIRQKYTL